MTGGDTTIVAGIDIPSTSPIFLTIVGFHVLVGSICLICGVAAMLSPNPSTLEVFSFESRRNFSPTRTTANTPFWG